VYIEAFSTDLSYHLHTENMDFEPLHDMAVEFLPSISPMTVCVSIVVIDDEDVEEEEMFRLELSTLQEQVLLGEPSSAAVTIVDDGKSQRCEHMPVPYASPYVMV